MNPALIAIAIYNQVRVRETVANFPLESKDLTQSTNICWVVTIGLTLTWLADIFIKDRKLGRKFGAVICIASLVACALIFFVF